MISLTFFHLSEPWSGHPGTQVCLDLLMAAGHHTPRGEGCEESDLPLDMQSPEAVPWSMPGA